MVETKTPIQNVIADLSGLKIKDGEQKIITVTLGFPLSHETLEYVLYLADCVRFGKAYITVQTVAPTLDAALEAVDSADRPPAEPGADPFPGWPKACGKPVRPQGMSAVCDDGHVTSTTLGEPCSYMPEPPKVVDVQQPEDMEF